MKLPVVPKPKDRTQSFYQGVARPELPPPFVSKDTIKALRITIRSIIDLIELLLGPSFNLTYVLTAKFNQDCLEVRLYIVVQWRTFITDLMTRIYFIFFFIYRGFLGSFAQRVEPKTNQPHPHFSNCSECSAYITRPRPFSEGATSMGRRKWKC